MPATGKLVRYRYVSRLGVGGMATVVLAEDTLLGRQVALKRVNAAADVRGLQRLRREALTGASISHRNLVSIYDVIDDEAGDLVIVMEYVRGRTLRQALDEQGRLAVPEALRILEGVAAGLDTIHRQGIVHRDVKPSNILLGEGGAVKVADLGIASVPDRTRITTTGSVLGSLSYMAPEQLADRPSTPAIDVYALAAVSFEVLSGRRARRAPNAMALAHAIATQPPPDLREVWAGAPSEVAELLTRGMSRDPAARPRSAGELIGRLRAGLDPTTTASNAPQPPPPPSPPRSARPAQTPPPDPPRRSRQLPPMPAAQSQPAAAGAASGPSEPDTRVDTAATGGPSRRWAPAVALLALVAAAAVIVVLLTNGSAPRATATSTTTGSTSTATAGASSSTAAGGSAPGSSSPSAGAPAGGPVAAVKSFYGFAAGHNYAAAWALADPTFRAQLGGYDSFQGGQSGDKSITFHTAQIVSQSGGSATVSVRTTSVRTDGTHQCSGTVDVRADGPAGRWLVHTISINCS